MTPNTVYIAAMEVKTKGEQVYDLAKQLYPERAQYVERLETIERQALDGSLTFDGLLDAIATCNHRARGKPISTKVIERCGDVAANHIMAIAAHDSDVPNKETVAAILRLCMALNPVRLISPRDVKLKPPYTVGALWAALQEIKYASIFLTRMNDTVVFDKLERYPQDEKATPSLVKTAVADYNQQIMKQERAIMNSSTSYNDDRDHPQLLLDSRGFGVFSAPAVTAYCSRGGLYLNAAFYAGTTQLIELDIDIEWSNLPGFINDKSRIADYLRALDSLTLGETFESADLDIDRELDDADMAVVEPILRMQTLDHPASEALAMWARAAVKASCLFTVRAGLPSAHLRGAFVDLVVSGN